MSQIRYADSKQNIEMVSRSIVDEAIVVAKTEKRVVEIVEPHTPPQEDVLMEWGDRLHKLSRWD